MLVENPPKWLFRSKKKIRQKCPNFCICPSIYLLNNALLFFSLICFSFSRKSKPKYRSVVEWCAMKRNKRKYLHKFALLFLSRVTWRKWLTRVHVVPFWKGAGSNLKIFALIFFLSVFFAPSFYFIFNKKKLFADLNRRTVLVRCAG